MREIDRGMSGPDVARWERFLVNKGHLARPGSGVFDEGSEAGTRAFQAASGMESSGRVDAVTLARGLADGLLDKNLSEEV